MLLNQKSINYIQLPFVEKNTHFKNSLKSALSTILVTLLREKETLCNYLSLDIRDQNFKQRQKIQHTPPKVFKMTWDGKWSPNDGTIRVIIT